MKLEDYSYISPSTDALKGVFEDPCNIKLKGGSNIDKKSNESYNFCLHAGIIIFAMANTRPLPQFKPGYLAVSKIQVVFADEI